MKNLNAPLLLLARILLSYMFITAGFGKLGDIQGSMAYTASGGIPGFMVFPAIAIEALGGLAVLVGFQTRWAALALAVFCVVTGYLFHYVPAQGLTGMEQMGQMINFQKNITIAGGFLALIAAGAGAFSVDAFLGRSRAARA
ncbi:DoxX family protein [Amaricoccus solimangrovi]|uniref:DoxX family protein n=1 Tax=Amaricoccus solimangrovi TaxID=2589815 RepID=A0A501WT67_9RHOB|nr:DoxX family protein [Amaricoccus solimangrovi]TPE50487.1 DoxX family protein [Amaricoccus solimangrovi]